MRTSPLTTPPLISVLIATRNRRRDVLETLDAVRALDHPRGRLELLVLDNGGDDGTEAAVRAWMAQGSTDFARVECLRSEDNVGASGARNRLVARAAPEAGFYFVLDDDAVPEAGFLSTMLATAQADPAIGVVGARIVAFDDPRRELAGAGFIDWRLGRFRDLTAARALDCDFVISCAALIRPAAFHAAGGFDEDYFVYHEDLDFCVRVRRRGFRVVYEPAAVARHKVPPGKTRTPDRLYYVLRNKFLFLRKHLPARRHPLPWLVYGTALVPLMLAQSIVLNRGLSGPELRTILAAGRDGLRGATGPWRR